MNPDTPPDGPARRRPWARIAGALGVLAFSALCIAAASAAVFGPPHQEARLSARLAKALPGSAVSAVDCDAASAPQGLCEFLVGRNVFYATPDGRYVIVGQILDLTRKVDLTERRRTEIRGLVSATDQISGGGPPPTPGPAPATAARPAPEPVLKIDLPRANAVVHHPGAPLKVTAFTDFNCHYCRQLFESLKDDQGVEFTEFPIAILGEGSARRARGVLCARDRAGAAAAAYGGASEGATPDCADGGRQLSENLAFAQRHGITGTPMIVRADGATNAGWMPKDRLMDWLRQGQTQTRGGR